MSSRAEDDFSALVVTLTHKLRATVDLKDLLDASKDDDIDPSELGAVASLDEWFAWLRARSLLAVDDVSFVEHVFELCRRPDLLSIVLDYRMRQEHIRKLQPQPRQLRRASNSGKYLNAGSVEMMDDSAIFEEAPALRLNDPPKNRRKSVTS